MIIRDYVCQYISSVYGLLGIYNFTKHLGFSRCTSIVRITSGARNFVETITQVLVISVVFFSVWQCILMNYEETIIILSSLYTLLYTAAPRATICAILQMWRFVTDKHNTLYKEKVFFTKWISSLVKPNLFFRAGFFSKYRKMSAS